MSRFQRKTVKLDPRERNSEFKKLYEITGVVGVGGGGTVYAGNNAFCLLHNWHRASHFLKSHSDFNNNPREF